jgi:hypothetical protein
VFGSLNKPSVCYLLEIRNQGKRKCFGVLDSSLVSSNGQLKRGQFYYYKSESINLHFFNDVTYLNMLFCDESKQNFGV